MQIKLIKRERPRTTEFSTIIDLGVHQETVFVNLFEDPDQDLLQEGQRLLAAKVQKRLACYIQLGETARKLSENPGENQIEFIEPPPRHGICQECHKIFRSTWVGGINHLCDEHIYPGYI